MRILVAVAALMLTSSCGDGVCPAVPCPVSIAVEVNVASSGGAQVPGLSVAVTGPSGTVPCQTSGATQCMVSGSRGTYQLDIGAPGFQSVHRTVQVTSSGTHGCNTCDIVDTQHLNITLAPAASAVGSE